MCWYKRGFWWHCHWPSIKSMLQLCFKALHFWNKSKYGMLFLLFQSVTLEIVFDLERITLLLHSSITCIHSWDIYTGNSRLSGLRHICSIFAKTAATKGILFSLDQWTEPCSNPCYVDARWFQSILKDKGGQSPFQQVSTSNNFVQKWMVVVIFLWSTMNSVIFHCMELKFWWLS